MNDPGTGKEAKRGLPLACNLSEPEMVKRRQELAGEVFGGLQRLDELEDGYAFGFPGSEEWATRLLRFVNTERVCCPFFVFELVFEPERGPILLRVRGPEGAKAFIEAEMNAFQTGQINGICGA